MKAGEFTSSHFILGYEGDRGLSKKATSSRRQAVSNRLYRGVLNR